MPNDIAQETQLIRHAAAGDPDAFARLYDKYVDAVYRFVFLRLGDEHNAEDLTSQVFIKAWEKLGGYEMRGLPFGAWLFRIARNITVDHYRAYRETVPLESDDASEAEAACDVDQEVETKVDLERLLSLMNSLTEDQRQVLTLKFVEGLSTEEIAQVMGKREGAIRALQMRGLQSLAALIEKKNG